MVLRLRYPAPDGWERAKCRDIEVSQEYDPFFEEDEEDAIEFCNGVGERSMCPIRHQCLLYALTNNESVGVWGGMSELGRRALRKKWQLQGREPRPEWQWMTTEDAVSGLDLSELLAPQSEDQEE